MPECPHKSIVMEPSGYGWHCEWCKQKFIPKTRDAAERLIKAEDEQAAYLKEMEAYPWPPKAKEGK